MVRNNILFILLLTSCSVFKKTDKTNFIINIQSALDKDVCTLIISNDTIFADKSVENDFSLGIDPKLEFSFPINNESIHILAKFKGSLIEEREDDLSMQREISIDTTLSINEGSYVLLSAGINKLLCFQSKRKFKLN